MSDQLTTQIAKDLGIAELPEKEQQELIAQFGEVALKAATVAVLGKLSAPKREEFMKLAEAGDPAAVQAFLDSEVPGHDEIAKTAVAAEVKLFRESTTN